MLRASLDIEHTFCYNTIAMLSTQERLEIFLEVLERVAPEMGARAMYNLNTPVRDINQSLSGLLERLSPLPPYSALIGMCEDGLPFLLDLSDTSPGSILIIADEQSGQTRLLQTILESACILNSPAKVVCSVISPNPGQFESLEAMDNCRAILSTYDRAASEMVVELAELADQRIYGRNQGGVELLAIDDLAAFVQNNDHEINCYLKWLVAHGSQGAVWPISSIKMNQLWRIRDGMYEAFGTHFIGRVSTSQLPAGLGAAPPHFEIPGVFSILMDGEWIHFWVPERNSL